MIKPGNYVCFSSNAFFLHLAAFSGLTPATLEFFIQAEAHATTVSHLIALVDQHVDVVGVVQGLALAPDHGKGGRHVGSPGGVGELHFVTKDCVAQKLSIDTGHTTFNVKLTNEPCLDDELGDVVNLNPNTLSGSVAHQNLRRTS